MQKCFVDYYYLSKIKIVMIRCSLVVFDVFFIYFKEQRIFKVNCKEENKII